MAESSSASRAALSSGDSTTFLPFQRKHQNCMGFFATKRLKGWPVGIVLGSALVGFPVSYSNRHDVLPVRAATPSYAEIESTGSATGVW